MTDSDLPPPDYPDYGEERAYMRQTIEMLTEIGCSGAEIIDYIMVVECDYSRRGWAKERGVARPAVSHHVREAQKKIDSADIEL